GLAAGSGFGGSALGGRLHVDAAAPHVARWPRRRSARSRRAGVSRLPRFGRARARVRPRARDPPMSATALRDEVTDLLQRLIRVDTTNPPGNETAAAELLRDYLEASGVACELIATE